MVRTCGHFWTCISTVKCGWRQASLVKVVQSSVNVSTDFKSIAKDFVTFWTSKIISPACPYGAVRPYGHLSEPCASLKRKRIRTVWLSEATDRALQKGLPRTCCPSTCARCCMCKEETKLAIASISGFPRLTPLIAFDGISILFCFENISPMSGGLHMLLSARYSSTFGFCAPSFGPPLSQPPLTAN